MTPSVEGLRKARVATVLVLAAAAAGGLAGFGAGVLWALTGLGQPPTPVVVAALALTALADGLYYWKGVPRPLSVRRQVPVLWTSLFAPETVALLYGARLGVGPLTILTTWAWWTAIVLAAMAGPVQGMAIAGLFAVIRVILMVSVSEWARKDMAKRMRRLVRREVMASVLTVGTSLVILLISALSV